MNTDIAIATIDDIPALCKLWQMCFDDSPEYISLFYQENFERITTYVCKAGGEIVSMLHVFDSCFKSGSEQQKALFLYAGATPPEKRQNGYFTKLIKHVLQYAKDSSCAVFLKPTAELVEYYKKLGFEPDSHFRLTSFSKGKAVPIAVNPLSAEQYNKLRNEAFSGTSYAKWDDSHLRWCVRENEFFEGKTFAVNFDGKNYFVMGAPEENAFLITETNLSPLQLKTISGALCEMFGTQCVKVYLPENACDSGEVILSSIVYNALLRDNYVNLILI